MQVKSPDVSSKSLGPGNVTSSSVENSADAYSTKAGANEEEKLNYMSD
jgi:hypothetical protein